MNESDQEILKRCRPIGTGTWSDAMDQLGIPGVLRGLSRRSGSGSFAGFAATAREIPGELGDFPPSDFGIGKIIAATNPGDILMIDMGGADIATFGGLAAVATVLRKVAAVIIDGACRDVDELQSSGLWLASRSVTPMSGKRRLRLGSMGEPIRVGGIPVRQGDLVIGDDTGIVVIPRTELDRVLALAEKAAGMDVQMEEAIRAGKSFSEAAATVKYL